MQYEYSPMQLAEITDFSFLKEWDTIRIVPEGYNEVVDRLIEDQQKSYVGTYTDGNFDSMKEDIARWAERNPDSPFAKADPTFTRSKGGTAEREEIISQIQVPHLWHTILGIREGTKVPKAHRDAVADDILECWHLAHDMRKHLQSNG